VVLSRDGAPTRASDALELSAAVIQRGASAGDARPSRRGDPARSDPPRSSDDGRRSRSGGERDRGADRDADINRLPPDPGLSVHSALAKLQPRDKSGEHEPRANADGASPALPTGADAEANRSATGGQGNRSFESLLEEASGSGTRDRDAKPSARGADLGAAIRGDEDRGDRAKAGAGAKAPALPKQLGPRQVAAWSGKLTAAVRKCAHRFGFARVSVPTRVTLQGSSGRVVGLGLGGRFKSTPLESCARRAASKLQAPRFSRTRQTLRIPVYVP
jgi:hypothetical protein